MSTTEEPVRVDPGLDPAVAKIIRPTVRSEHTPGHKVIVNSRAHQWVIDEPKEKGGTDLGPTPLEAMLGSLAACESVVLGIVANAMGFAYTRVDIDCTGEADLRGARGVKGVRPYFSRMSVDIVLATDEPAPRIETLRRNVEARCPIMNLVKGADVALDVNWTIVPA